MVVLMGFALIAGAGTAITPCVLPVLPALLSASAIGGRQTARRHRAGLMLTFTITIVGLASVIDGVGVADDAARTVAIAVLVGFGVTAAGARASATASRPRCRGWRASARARAATASGRDSWSAARSASSMRRAPGRSWRRSCRSARRMGSSLEIARDRALIQRSARRPCCCSIALGGRRTIDRDQVARPRPRRCSGRRSRADRHGDRDGSATCDVRFQTALADRFPDFIVNPTEALEGSNAVANAARRPARRVTFDSTAAADAAARAQASDLPVLGEAPDFTGNQRWFNTPDGRPLTLGGLRGRVVLIDFWTYTCINCIRTLPLRARLGPALRATRADVVGVHTPEFGFEKDAGNVERRSTRTGSAIRSRRTTTTRPGTPGATSTGRPST